MTIKDLILKAKEMALKENEFEDIVDQLLIEYQMFDPKSEMELHNPKFTVKASTSHGASEGIYAVLNIEGWVNPNTTINDRVLTIKTLRDDKMSFFAMGRYANLLAYCANEFVRENIDLFL